MAPRIDRRAGFVETWNREAPRGQGRFKNDCLPIDRKWNDRILLQLQQGIVARVLGNARVNVPIWHRGTSRRGTGINSALRGNLRVPRGFYDIVIQSVLTAHIWKRNRDANDFHA